MPLGEKPGLRHVAAELPEKGGAKSVYIILMTAGQRKLVISSPGLPPIFR